MNINQRRKLWSTYYKELYWYNSNKAERVKTLIRKGFASLA